MNHKLRILPLLVTAMFASCSPAQSEQMSKNAFSEYEIKSYQHLDWPDILKQKEANYLIFFYSDTCTHCQEIIEDVYYFIRDDIIKTFLINTKETSVKVPVANDTENTIGKSDVEDIFIKGTPSIIEINQATVINNIAGKDKCLTFLNNARLLHKT